MSVFWTVLPFAWKTILFCIFINSSRLFICQRDINILFSVIQESSMGSPRRVLKADRLTWWRYREKRLSCGLTADGEESLLLLSHTRPGSYEEDAEPRDDALNWTETLPTGWHWDGWAYNIKIYPFLCGCLVIGWYEFGFCHGDGFLNSSLICCLCHRNSINTVIKHIKMTRMSAFL